MAIDETQHLLVVRPRDLVVLTARCKGFDVDGGALVARAPSAFLELTFPPQATAELAFDATTQAPSPARVSGPSRVTFAVAGGTRVPLTADGLLAALAAAPQVAADGDFDASALAIELPWRLVLSPRARVGGDVLRATVPGVTPEADGGTALWHVGLEAAGGLALVPIAGGDDDGISPPLNRDQRDRIRAEAEASGSPPVAPSIDLSALGGTMTAAGTWPTYAWAQTTVLGRDMAVHTEAKGFLYPFGHRAVLIRDVQRVMEPADGPATAGLQERNTLIVGEQLRGAPDDAALRRGFPFDEVEILQQTFELGASNEVPGPLLPRRAKRLEALSAEVAAAQQELKDANEAVPGILQAARDAVQSDANTRIAELEASFEPFRQELADLEAQQKAFQDFVPPPPHTTSTTAIAVAIDPTDPTSTGFVDIHGNPVDPGTNTTETTDPGPAPLTQAQFDRMRELQAMREGINNQEAQIQADAEARIASINTEEDIPDDPGIQHLRELRKSVPALEQHLADVQHAIEPHLAVFEWPLGKDGARVGVPVRCGGLQIRLPLLFVHDIDLPETDDFERLAPLEDAAIQQAIADSWRASAERTVALPGVAIDLVRDAEPKPGDVVPVHALTLAGTPHEGGFRPAVEQITADLPAVRALVPGHDELTKLAFDDAYVKDGAAERFALKLVGSLSVDFSKAADRSGGLVSPVFAADVLSREHGPVDVRAIPAAGPPDLEAVFGDATLLGIRLSDVVDAAALPAPLTIVDEHGGGARMTWSDLPLKSHGPLEVKPGATRFELSVLRSAAETTTTCRMTEFAFVLPPGGGGLIRLDFKALTFLQKLGEAPALDVDGLEVSLGGDLGLLKQLEDAVELGDAAPDIRSTPNGMSASYVLAIPEVTAGMFVMRDISVRAGVEVPFDGRPVVASLGFATRDDPFNLSVSAFGGGGYVCFEIGQEGIRALEASLDFGATVAIGVGIAKAEVHALGGVRFLLQGDVVRVAGFLRIGGSVDVLGLVSVSVELKVELSYENDGALRGRATAVIEIDVLFWSGSVELDSGEYEFFGGAAAHPSATVAATPAPPSLPDWQRYRDAFAPVPA